VPRSPRRVASTIAKLPTEVRELIGRLREQGQTIDAILAKLNELDVEVSRSALGRHIKGLAEIGEEMRRSREIATALVARFGDEPDNRVARLNIELMHGLVMRAITASTEGEEGAPGGPVSFGPEDTMFLARSLQSLASAQKIDADRLLKVRVEVAKDAVKAVKKVASERGMTADTVDAITRAVLGVA
jgi:biotin operon repressor